MDRYVEMLTQDSFLHIAQKQNFELIKSFYNISQHYRNSKSTD